MIIIVGVVCTTEHLGPLASKVLRAEWSLVGSYHSSTCVNGWKDECSCTVYAHDSVQKKSPRADRSTLCCGIHAHTIISWVVYHVHVTEITARRTCLKTFPPACTPIPSCKRTHMIREWPNLRSGCGSQETKVFCYSRLLSPRNLGQNYSKSQSGVICDPPNNEQRYCVHALSLLTLILRLACQSQPRCVARRSLSRRLHIYAVPGAYSPCPVQIVQVICCQHCAARSKQP